MHDYPYEEDQENINYLEYRNDCPDFGDDDRDIDDWSDE